MAAHLVLPWIHQVFSNLKGWARGVYHGLRAKHLQSYLDEFVVPASTRRRTRHCHAFRSLFGIAVCTKPFTYNMLVRRRKLVHKRFTGDLGRDYSLKLEMVSFIGWGFLLGCVASFISEDATVIESCVAWGGAYVVSLLIAAIVGLGRL